ncbi:MAG: DNA-formamidopyrimidine glycosylase [Limnochordia bacterium]
MPELPEVETVRRTLDPVIVGKRIERCAVCHHRALPQNNADEFCRILYRRTITGIMRRGKYLIISLDQKLELVAHLRMTGQLIYRPKQDLPLQKHVSARFWFENNGELRFVDQRKFGTLYLVKKGNYGHIRGLITLGPEPLSSEFTWEVLADGVRSVRAIKTILLDQTKVAGLGNIYADEALYRAGIHPLKPGACLSDSEIEALHSSIVAVLKEAIANHGTTIRDYRTGSGDTGSFQNKLEVYRRTGKPCGNCGTLIEKIKVGGRGTHFCPNCQRWDPGCMD